MRNTGIGTFLKTFIFYSEINKEVVVVNANDNKEADDLLHEDLNMRCVIFNHNSYKQQLSFSGKGSVSFAI